MGYRFTHDPKGQYVDGHERKDVVEYRSQFIFEWVKNIEPDIYCFTRHGDEEHDPERDPTKKHLVVWYHDESTFYAHDRCTKRWVKISENPVPYAKGEGASLMVADFVSAKYGYLQSLDGTQSARRLFRAGKNRDGYFTNAEIIEQVRTAMEIVKECYPNEDHIFVYDNATTHQKRRSAALSASHMVKNPHATWGPETNQLDDDGKPITNTRGKYIKAKIRMEDGTFDGKPHSFYYPDDHPEYPGWFKGMQKICEERGFTKKLNGQCKDFKCHEGATECCYRRILHNQPDFINVKSHLEEICEAEGFRVIFLPKFHCELNPIEQCWGYAKRLYRMCPPSSREDDLERNVISSLNAIPLSSIRRFSNRAIRFMDAYHKGLNGKQAIWASRRYRSHRILPDSLMDDMELAGI